MPVPLVSGFGVPSGSKPDCPDVATVDVLLVRSIQDVLVVGSEADVLDFKVAGSEQDTLPPDAGMDRDATSHPPPRETPRRLSAVQNS